MHQTRLIIILMVLIGAISLVGVGWFRHQPPRPLKQTAAPPPPIELMAWLAWWDQAQTLNSLEANHSYLTTISPSWYHLDDTGQVQRLAAANPQPIYNLATQSGLLIIPTVGNDLDSAKATTFLADPNNFAPAVDFLLTEASAAGYSGYDLDFESIPNQYTSAYTQFLTLLADKLHDKGLKLAVAVHARTGASSDWELALSHDYSRIGSVADQIRLMAYDFHYADSPPGPVTPLDKLEAVLTYARQYIPARKIVLGIPLYGYDWPEDDRGESITFAEAQHRLSLYQGTQARDPISKAMIGQYLRGDTSHTVWFEDSQSTLDKINQARARGISRFIFWRLGDEDPNTWPTIAAAALLNPGK